MLDLSVVIVNHKTKDLVNRCLDSLFLDATDSGLNFSTVVVDNASDDGLEFNKRKVSSGKVYVFSAEYRFWPGAEYRD